MSDQSHAIPLTRRLVSQYLMFGLGCLFICLSFSLTLAWRGELHERVWIAAGLAVVILLTGGLVLQRTVALTSQIESQLQRAADPQTWQTNGLQPLSTGGAAALGWNALLERVSRQEILANIESRLSSSLSTSSQQRLQDILNSLPDGVALTDAQGRILLANRALQALVAADSETGLIGRTIPEILSLESVPDSEAIRQKLAQSLRVLSCEIQRGTALHDGVWRIGRYPLAERERTATEYVWTIRDVTQQRLADETRNQFVFTATHELRTPLANIKAYAETLSMHDDIDVEEQKRFYNTICSEATRLSRFVDELLNVSRMQSGALSLVRHETDIQRLVSEVVAHVRPEMDARQIRLHSQLPAKLPKLSIDKDKISAALVNLLGNAAKYTPEGGEVRLGVNAEGSSVQFVVEDTGIGISAEDLPKVFDKFFRSDDERVRGISGTGLGLAFTQEVARLHGGSVSVQSELHKGSRFTMNLPL